MRFSVIICSDDDGHILIDCPLLRNCSARGETRQEALQAIRGAIQGALLPGSSVSDFGDYRPDHGDVEHIEVETPPGVFYERAARRLDPWAATVLAEFRELISNALPPHLTILGADITALLEEKLPPGFRVDANDCAAVDDPSWPQLESTVLNHTKHCATPEEVGALLLEKRILRFRDAWHLHLQRRKREATRGIGVVSTAGLLTGR